MLHEFCHFLFKSNRTFVIRIMKRDIEQKLKTWREDRRRKPLLQRIPVAMGKERYIDLFSL